MNNIYNLDNLLQIKSIKKLDEYFLKLQTGSIINENDILKNIYQKTIIDKVILRLIELNIIEIYISEYSPEEKCFKIIDIYYINPEVGDIITNDSFNNIEVELLQSISRLKKRSHNLLSNETFELFKNFINNINRM